MAASNITVNVTLMKKNLIYFILSIILILPITSIIVIAVLNRPTNSTTEYTVPFNYTDLEIHEVAISDFEEEIVCKGFFDSMDFNVMKVRFNSLTDTLYALQPGDYLDLDTVLGVFSGKELNSDYCGKLIEVQNDGFTVSYIIKSENVTRIRVELPIETYAYVETSCGQFTFAGERYNLEYACRQNLASNDGSSFSAYYTIVSATSDDDFRTNSFVLDGMVSVTIKTGRVSKDTLSVPQKCLFLSESGEYYLKVVNPSEGTSNVYVRIGLMDETNVEILPSDDANIYANTLVSANSVNIFAKKDDTSFDAEKLTEGE